ncbi:MAG: hypothetical protein AAF320_05905 [Myxococcota bacterium]
MPLEACSEGTNSRLLAEVNFYNDKVDVYAHDILDVLRSHVHHAAKAYFADQNPTDQAEIEAAQWINDLGNQKYANLLNHVRNAVRYLFFALRDPDEHFNQERDNLQWANLRAP